MHYNLNYINVSVRIFRTSTGLKFYISVIFISGLVNGRKDIRITNVRICQRLLLTAKQSQRASIHRGPPCS